MLSLDEIKTRQEPAKVLLVKPDHYTVIDTKNPYMEENTFVDQNVAQDQWQGIRKAYQNLQEKGVLEDVVSLEGGENKEDMVYCANQSFPWQKPNGEKHVIISNMKHDSRQREVIHFEEFYKEIGYQLHHVPDNLILEGMGDCIPHPHKELIWMGHGWRSSLESATEIERILNVKVIPLKLVSEYFYHLDTCFLPISEDKVILCASAFDSDSMQKIKEVFSEVIEVDEKEATETFCLNTTCIYNKETPSAIMPKGDHTVKRVLLENGYSIQEVDTSEFIKGGGSVFCMKMMFY